MLTVCSGCGRHHRVDEARCPHCAGPARSVGPTAAAVALGLAITTAAACGTAQADYGASTTIIDPTETAATADTGPEDTGVADTGL